MEFSYSGSIDALKMFYLSMRKINVQIGAFEYTYNGVISDVIFDTRGSKCWQLLFIKRGNGDALGYYYNLWDHTWRKNTKNEKV